MGHVPFLLFCGRNWRHRTMANANLSKIKNVSELPGNGGENGDASQE
jgi:hypothetical protein